MTRRLVSQRSRFRRAHALPASLAVVALAVPWPAHAQDAAELAAAAGLPIELDAESTEIDRRNDRLVFHGIRITQGELGISADTALASDLDFRDSEWVFSGEVTIDGPQTRIAADRAQLHFRRHRLRTVELSGEPVRFERANGTVSGSTRGSANRIEYDFDASVLHLRGDAWLAEGKNEITGNEIVYDIAGQRVRAAANGDGSERVRITITPPADTERDPQAPAGDVAAGDVPPP